MNRRLLLLIPLLLSLFLSKETVMTTPTFNAAALDLPSAITSVSESSTITRVGTVSEIAESDNITVKISGSPTLVRASYLFPQYQPVLGDRVIVQKQDAQWLVLGTLSGPINSLFVNPTFEEGVVGALPTGWTISSVSAAGGPITFTKVTTSLTGSAYQEAISGSYVGSILFTNNGATTPSISDIFSTAVQTQQDERWAVAFWVAGGIIANNASFLGQVYVQWLDAGGSLLSEVNAITFPFISQTVYPLFLRPGQTSFQAPAGTDSVRLRINALFNMTTGSAGLGSSVDLDYMLLRKV